MLPNFFGLAVRRSVLFSFVLTVSPQPKGGAQGAAYTTYPI